MRMRCPLLVVVGDATNSSNNNKSTHRRTNDKKRDGVTIIVNTPTINNTTTINSNTSVNINAFGKEALDHLTEDFMDQCVRRRDKGLIELIEKIHFDRPENKNLRITNLKLPFIQCHDGQRWMYDRKDRILNKLVDHGHELMQDHLDDHEDRIRDRTSETMFDCICKWMSKIQGRDKKTLEPVLTDIYLLILNSSSLEPDEDICETSSS
jgi:hypothetical protein